MPPPNAFLTQEQLGKAAAEEHFYPLDVYFCEDCSLVQLVDIVSPDELFRNYYMYLTGASQPMKTHFASFAEDVAKRAGLKQNDLVVDVGGNDGTLLSAFKQLGMRVLNVEPATNVAKISEQYGIEALCEYWGEKTAVLVGREKGKATVITATNVFAHVNDWDDFVKGVDALLAPGGTFVIEAPYLVDLLEKNEFDTIYHEHLSYLAVRPLTILFKRFNMKVADVQRDSVHGGSIRVFVKREADSAQPSPAVAQLVALEERLGLNSIDAYKKFAQRVQDTSRKLVDVLAKLKNEKKRVVGYGAAAKGTVLLNYCKIGPSVLDYIVDSTPLKQGKFMPGVHVPVFPIEKLHEDSPDYVLLLAWNYADQILAKEAEYRAKGGKFIIPIPEPKTV